MLINNSSPFFFSEHLKKKRIDKIKKRIYQTDDSLGSDIKPRILNDGTPFFLKEFATCSSVLLTNPSARAGYDIRSIFKRSLTGLNSEFSFS